MPDLDPLAFDILLAIKLDTFVPTSKRARSEWAEHVAEKIAARLRQGWELTRKPGIEKGPSAMAQMRGGGG